MTARAGMNTLITDLRALTNAGTADYTIAGSTYWSDDQLQAALDRARADVIREQLIPNPAYEAGGSVLYYEYRSRWGNYESGTAVFKLQNGDWSTDGTADYTADYAGGVFTFLADQAGSAHYLTGRRYDVNAAAADVWRQKASYAAAMYSFTTDNMRVDRGKLAQEYRAMADYYTSLAQVAVTSIDAYRSDTIPMEYEDDEYRNLYS